MKTKSEEKESLLGKDILAYIDIISSELVKKMAIYRVPNRRLDGHKK